MSVYDVGSDNGTDYIVMELMEGVTLKEYLQKKGHLPWQEALFFAQQICRALVHAHSRGIIHQDKMCIRDRDKQMAVIDWTKPARAVDCLIRGLNPWPVALTTLAGARLKVYAAEPVSGHGRPGEVLESDPKKGLTVACGEGALRLTEIQPVGGKRMGCCLLYTSRCV